MRFAQLCCGPSRANYADLTPRQVVLFNQRGTTHSGEATGKGSIMSDRLSLRRKLPQKRHLSFARLARLSAVPIVIGVAFAFTLVLGGSHQSSARATALQSALYSPGGGEPGEVSLTKVEQFWQTRLTYPTGRFNQRWVTAAAKKAKLIKTGIPQGHYKAWRSSGVGSAKGSHATQSIKALAAARPLGPQPQVSTGCQAPCFTFGLVSGRVSAIAFDPNNTSVAYLAQDGGGIWKTTTCCT
ncbi:MAG: hypothetical protein M3Q31_26525, partial [Actinomycetota bacterium]|nr:hypothetical protein [Actinomycetota bacterium]